MRKPSHPSRLVPSKYYLILWLTNIIKKSSIGFKWLFLALCFFWFCLINFQFHRVTSISLLESLALKHSAEGNFTRQTHWWCFESFVGFLFLWGRKLNKNKIACHDFYDLLPLAINIKPIFYKVFVFSLWYILPISYYFTIKIKAITVSMAGCVKVLLLLLKWSWEDSYVELILVICHLWLQW